jgi:hypothetical protein
MALNAFDFKLGVNSLVQRSRKANLAVAREHTIRPQYQYPEIFVAHVTQFLERWRQRCGRRSPSRHTTI